MAGPVLRSINLAFTRLQARAIGDADGVCPPHADRLQSLAAHDGAGARSSSVAAIVADGGELDLVLAGWADGRDAVVRPGPPQRDFGGSGVESQQQRRRDGSATSPSVTSSTLQAVQAPCSTSASKPVRFNSIARWLEDSESPMKPVSGDLAMTAYLAEVVMLVPTNGLVTKISGASGTKRIHVGGTLAIQQIRAQSDAADKRVQDLLRQRLLPGARVRQVHVQDLALVAVHHV